MLDRQTRVLNNREKYLSNFLRVLCGVITLLMIVFSIVGLFPQGVKFGLIMLIGLVFVTAAIIISVFKLSDSKYRIFWLTIILIGIALRIVYSLTIDVSIVSDQQHCLTAAQQAANGDFSWATSDDYFVVWAYQIPFVLYESVILKIFGTIRALYVFNGLFSILTCIFIYLIFKKVYQKNVALITTAIFACFPMLICSISRLYNQIIAGVFLLCAIYFFIDVCKQPTLFVTKKAIKNIILPCALTGMFLGISNVFRPEAIIGVLAVVVWFAYSFITKANKKNVWTLLLGSAIGILAAYLSYKIVNVGVGTAVIFSGISPNGISNGCIYWTIVCGMTPDSYGGYSTTYISILDYKEPSEQFVVFKKMMAEIFSNRSIGDIIHFFVMKEYKMWGEIYYCCELNNAPNLVYVLLNNISHGIYIITALFALLGLRKRKFNPTKAFLIILFLGFFMALVIKEANSPYRYSTVLVLVLMSANGIEYLIDKKMNIKSRFLKDKKAIQ